MVGAVIVAAGSGRRMGRPLPKQVLPLAGRPLVEHSIRAFQRCDEVDRIVLVIPSRLRAVFPLKLGAYDKLVAMVDGGDSRQASVGKGLEALGESDWVLVHDAARPLVTEGLIQAVLRAAQAHGAAVPGCAARDTLKRVQEERVTETVSRDGLVLVQTPQAFRTDVLRAAHRAAAEAGFTGTDDAQLVERIGAPVAWVQGDARNLKVTLPEDLEMAEWLLQHGRGAWGS
jgi:2-C-methyl-D-erythritol 4-phosphate cytidylyltransferase